jgi:hypothetical protein
MCGESVFTAVWQAMHFDVAGVPARSPGSGIAWQSLQASFAASACVLWLNGTG